MSLYRLLYKLLFDNTSFNNKKDRNKNEFVKLKNLSIFFLSKKKGMLFIFLKIYLMYIRER